MKLVKNRRERRRRRATVHRAVEQLQERDHVIISHVSVQSTDYESDVPNGPESAPNFWFAVIVQVAGRCMHRSMSAENLETLSIFSRLSALI